MRLLLLFLVVALAVAAVVVVLRRRRAGARAALQEQAFPAEWRATLERTFPLYRRLSVAERERLHGLVQVFLAEKNFEGCGGLELTDEIRVTIAAQACLLLLNLEEADFFARLRSILVYPSAVTPAYVERHASGELPPEEAPVLGQSWKDGAVILSWNSVRGGAAAANDGRNVVFHEFAHQLDQETGDADGTPYLESGSALRTWGEVMREHYLGLREAVEDDRKTFLDDYGAQNPAEFFAVATEFFFEKPVQLKRKHPALFEELARYYGQDPTRWTAEG